MWSDCLTVEGGRGVGFLVPVLGGLEWGVEEGVVGGGQEGGVGGRAGGWVDLETILPLQMPWPRKLCSQMLEKTK